MLKRIQIPLFILAAALLAGFLNSAITDPALAVQYIPVAPAQQDPTTQPAPYPSPIATVSATPELMDERPVERNPFLIAGGVLIFLVILFGVWRYSHPPETPNDVK